MFKEAGMYVIHYGNESSQVVCDEHVTVTTHQELIDHHGDHDWKTRGVKFTENDPIYESFIKNSIEEIGKRKQPNDIILCMWGGTQKLICDAHPDIIHCEPSVGYPSQFSNYRVYESYAMLHTMSGPEFVSGVKNNFYHAVIPSGFDLSEFEYKEKKLDYYLMCGRLGWGKGVHIAANVCKHIGAKLVLMGTTDGPEHCQLGDTWPDHVDYVGYAGVEKRKFYMSNAKALFCPTLYTEPFGYVAIEAMLSGTPVISTDWGGFTETVQHGVTGYRCRTFEQFCWAAKNIHNIKSSNCRAWAELNYNQDRIGKMYREYFQGLIQFVNSDWYALNPDRDELNWLTKYYP